MVLIIGILFLAALAALVVVLAGQKTVSKNGDQEEDKKDT